MHSALIDRAHPGHPCGGDVLPGLTSDTTMRASASSIAWEFLLGPFIMDGIQGWVKNGTGSLALRNSVVFNGSLRTARAPLLVTSRSRIAVHQPHITKARNTSSERDWNLTGTEAQGQDLPGPPSPAKRRLIARSIDCSHRVGRSSATRGRTSQDLLVPKQHSAREWRGLYDSSQPLSKPRADYPC